MTEETNAQICKEEDNGLDIFDYVIILAKHKKIILLITLPVAIISIIISILSTTSFYKAQTSILLTKQKQTSMANQLMSQFGIFSGGGGSSNIYNNQKLFVEIIKSREFTDKLMKQFNLYAQDRTKDPDKARKKLLKHIIIDPDFTNKQRLILNNSNASPLTRITVLDKNPQKAADIANAIVKELNIFVHNIAISEAEQRRLFFENQLKQASDALIKTEEDMKAFQEKTGILAVGGKINITINKYAPALILEYKRIFREIKFNETLHEIIVKQYEAAKLDEAKDATLIQVIDKAVPPKNIMKTRRWGGSKALATIALTFLFSCVFAFAKEFHMRASVNNAYGDRVKALIKYIAIK